MTTSVKLPHEIQQAGRLAVTKYVNKVPDDLCRIGVTPLVLGICEILKPKLEKKGFVRGDWHYWDLYSEFAVSSHSTWPAGGATNPERFWIPLWHDWYRILVNTRGVIRVTFDSEGCMVTVRTIEQEVLSVDGSTPLEAIAKATLTLLVR